MPRTVLLALMASAIAAAPAMAGDLVLSSNDATPLSEHAVGKPYWVIQAQCAGLYGATANFHNDQHREKAASGDQQMGVTFMNDAIERLQQDRKLDFEAALTLAGAQVDTARAHSKSLLDSNRRDAWNVERSFCLDVYDAYHHARR
jgi:hypothetical protein